MSEPTIIDVVERDHWERYTEVFNEVHHRRPATTDQVIAWAAEAPDHVRRRRCLVESDGETVGAFATSHATWYAEEDVFSMRTSPQPGHERTVAEAAISATQGLGAKRISVWADSDRPQDIDLLESLGFVSGQRNPVTRLDLRKFEPEAWWHRVESALGQGYEILPWSETGHLFANPIRTWWRLEMDVLKDVPLPYPFQEAPYEEWEAEANGYGMDHSLCFVAVKDGEAAASTGMVRNMVDPTLGGTLLTGCLREHRRRGLAAALKIFSLAEAKRRGIEKMYTDNEETNPMLELNKALGFEVEYEAIEFSRDA